MVDRYQHLEVLSANRREAPVGVAYTAAEGTIIMAIGATRMQTATVWINRSILSLPLSKGEYVNSVLTIVHNSSCKLNWPENVRRPCWRSSAHSVALPRPALRDLLWSSTMVLATTLNSFGAAQQFVLWAATLKWTFQALSPARAQAQ